LAQARLVTELLTRAEPGREVEVVPIRTAGDERGGLPANDAARSNAAAGDKSRFVKEIEEALLAEEVDLAVHSAKDVPGELPDGLSIVGVPERAGALDALCGAGALSELPEGAAVGTSSLRRRSQLLAERPDLDVRDLRGNVDTRLRRLSGGDFSAVVLAAAGLERLGRRAGGLLSQEVMTPAAGQGCLALEARTDDRRAAALADAVTHHESLVRLTAERALVTEIGATCRTPVGAHALLAGGEMSVSAFVGLPNGSSWIRDTLAGDSGAPGDLGRAVGERLLAAGAADMLAEAERHELQR
jgi:hydroxymethylbilane synthase